MPAADETTEQTTQPPELVICIPGPWLDRDVCFNAVMHDSDGYVMFGEHLLNVALSFKCEIEFCGPDQRMEQAFSASGSHWRDTPEMRAIAEHRSVVYLVGQGGTYAAAEAMILAAGALLDAGGLGVKIESSGLAHPVEKFRNLVAQLYMCSAHEALVVYVTGREIYSCGMHLLGLPDAITTSAGKEEGVELLREFTRYLFREAPEICDGQTFAADPDSPGFRLRRDHSILYPPGSLFANPYGYWRLEPLDSMPVPTRKRWWN